MNRQIKTTVLVISVICLAAGVFLLVRQSKKAEDKPEVVYQPEKQSQTIKARLIDEQPVIKRVEASRFKNTWRPRPSLADTNTAVDYNAVAEFYKLARRTPQERKKQIGFDFSVYSAEEVNEVFAKVIEQQRQRPELPEIRGGFTAEQIEKTNRQAKIMLLNEYSQSPVQARQLAEILRKIQIRSLETAGQLQLDTQTSEAVSN